MSEACPSATETLHRSLADEQRSANDVDEHELTMVSNWAIVIASTVAAGGTPTEDDVEKYRAAWQTAHPDLAHLVEGTLSMSTAQR